MKQADSDFSYATVRPVDKLKVPDPDHGGHLPKEGRQIVLPLSSYWRRRLADGSITVDEDSSKKITATAKKADA